MRIKALDVAHEVSATEKAAALDRIGANAALGQKVEQAMVMRADTYHAAVETLYALSPDNEAKQAIAALDALRAEIDKGGDCSTQRPAKGPKIIRKG
jgi:hypothetical protein